MQLRYFRRQSSKRRGYSVKFDLFYTESLSTFFGLNMYHVVGSEESKGQFLDEKVSLTSNAILFLNKPGHNPLSLLLNEFSTSARQNHQSRAI